MRLGGTDSEWHLVRDMDSSGTEHFGGALLYSE